MRKTKKVGISAREVKDFFVYDEQIGRLRWKREVRIAAKLTGTIAGGEWKNGNSYYRRITIKGRTYVEHALVWAYFNDTFPSGVIDHINHNGLDNHIENLRDVSRRENTRNATLRVTNRSGVNGVHYKKSMGKWEAQIRNDHKVVSLGYFASLEEAAAARKAADIEYGYHRNHGSNTV